MSDATATIEKGKDRQADNYITGFGSFPRDWEKWSISDCANIRDNERIPLNSSEREEKKPGDIPYYGANGVVDHINEYLFDTELILLAEDGGHFDEFQDRPIAYRVSGKAWVNNHAHVLEARDGVETEYLFYSLEHRNLVPYVSGSTRSKLTKTMLQKVKVAVPPLDEQRKIASVLLTVDRAIQTTEAIIAQAKRVKRGLMQTLLKRGLSGEKMIETETRFGRLPESWTVEQIKSVGTVAGRTAPEKDDAECWGGDIPWATPGEITKLEGTTISKTKEYLTERALEKVPSNLLPAGSVLLTTRATVGACAVNTVPMTTNQGFKNVIPGDRVDVWYLYYRLIHEAKHLEARAKGSTFREVGKDTVENFEIPIPPLDEQKRIGQVLKSVDDQILKDKETVAEYKRLKKGLMQDLLTGRVRTTGTNIGVLDEVQAHG